MRDAESVRRIEDEIEMSRRLSASGRLTRGVAHEVKNPINAIVLHLQLLQNKMQQDDPETRRHMDIIGNEIHRLDRVVQILVDFTRPRDLAAGRRGLAEDSGERSGAGRARCRAAQRAQSGDLPDLWPPTELRCTGARRFRSDEAGDSEPGAERRAVHGGREARSRWRRGATTK